MVWLADDNVVKHLNLQELAGPDEVSGYFDVGFRRSRISRGMVVRQDEGGGGANACQPKHLSRMHQECIQGARGNNLMALNPAPGVQENNREAFHLRVEVRVSGNVPPPVGGCQFRRVTEWKVLRGGALPQRHHFVFIRGGRELEWRNQGLLSKLAEDCFEFPRLLAALRRNQCAKGFKEELLTVKGGCHCGVFRHRNFQVFQNEETREGKQRNQDISKKSVRGHESGLVAAGICPRCNRQANYPFASNRKV